MLVGVTRWVVSDRTLVLAGCASLTEAFDALTGQHPTSDHRETPLPEPPCRRRPSRRPTAGNGDSTQPLTRTAGAEHLPRLWSTACPAMPSSPCWVSPHRAPAPAPGETWTYRSGPCELELFLFPDVTQGGLHVLDYRVNGAGPRDDGEQACLRRLRNDQSS